MNMNEKRCKNCSKFPCTRKECDIFSEKACEVFESTVQKELKDMQMKLVKQDGYKWKFERVD